MLLKVIQITSLVSLLALSVLYPLIESLDRWDALTPGSDSEIQIIAILTFAAVGFLVGHLLTLLAMSVVSKVLARLTSPRDTPVCVVVFSTYSSITTSPPISLRI